MTGSTSGRAETGPGNLGVMVASTPNMLDSPFDPRSDVFNRLLKDRVVLLGAAVDDDIANQLCAQLLYLEGEDKEKDIWLYINSPGGSVTAGMAIYDTMQFVSCDVATVCIGLAASMGQFLLTAGAPGKRYSLPNARILMHQPLAGLRGQAADIAIQAQEFSFTKKRMAELIAYHSGRTARGDPARQRSRQVVLRRGGAGLRAVRQGDRPARRDPLTRALTVARPPGQAGSVVDAEAVAEASCDTIVTTGPRSTPQLTCNQSATAR